MQKIYKKIKALFYDGKNEKPTFLELENSFMDFRRILGSDEMFHEYPLGAGYQPEDSCIEISYTQVDSPMIYSYFDLNQSDFTAVFPGPMLITGFGWDEDCCGPNSVSLETKYIENIQDNFKIIGFNKADLKIKR